MAFNGSYVNISHILDKLYQDYRLADIEYNEVAEDIWDIIGYVADEGTYETKFAEVVITDFKGALPSDFFNIVGGSVIEKDTNIPLTASMDLMDRFSSDDTILADTDALEYTYRIISGDIITGIEEGTLMVNYKAFPVENGLPLVPDHAKAIRMVVDYVAEKIAFRLMMADKLSERKYDRILQKSCWATASWSTASKIPSVDTMERLKNIHLNILRNPNMHDNQFKHLGTRAKVYTNPIDEDQELTTTIYFELTATADGQTTFARPTTVSAANLTTVDSLGTWIATISGTEYTLTEGTDISYDSSTDIITYVNTNYGVLSEDDTIEFTYQIQ